MHAQLYRYCLTVVPSNGKSPRAEKIVLMLISLGGIEAGEAPSDGLPFEFDRAGGSVVEAHNVLTESVSADGGKVLKTNGPQSINRYNFETGSIGSVGSNPVVHQFTSSSTSSGGGNIGNAGGIGNAKINGANSGKGSFKTNNDGIVNYVINSSNGGQKKKQKVKMNRTKTVATVPTYSVYTINGGNGNAKGQYNKRINSWSPTFSEFLAFS